MARCAEIGAVPANHLKLPLPHMAAAAVYCLYVKESRLKVQRWELVNLT
jgi:hypothetical protein